MRKISIILAGYLIIITGSILAQVPTISSFNPTSGPVGSGIVIAGTNFDPIPTNNEVFFGTVQATITSATSTLLFITVPPGASYERISVLVNGSIAMSTKPFEVTFESDGNVAVESFDTSELFEIGAGPYLSITVDLDEDGLLDVLVTNTLDDNISLLRNSSTGIGDINFEDRVNYQVGDNPNELVTADFDADGMLDVAVANLGSGDISILRNTSSGSISFDTKLDFAAGANPYSLAVSDVDGDGKVDIAVVDQDNDVVSILRNTSSGAGVISFATKVDFATGDQPSRVTIADIDLDLKPDLLVANASGSLSILLNSSSVGTASFATKQDYSLSGQATHIVTSDFDKDGSIDIAVSCVANSLITGSQNKIEFFRNTSSPGSLSFVGTDSNVKAYWMSLSDINGDGKLDMFFSDPFNGSSILENESTIGSISFSDDVYIGTSIFTVSITSVNLDNDGEPDIILTGVSIGVGSAIQVYRNLGSGASFGDYDIPGNRSSRDEELAKTNFSGFSVLGKSSSAATIDPINHTIDITVADCTDPTALVVSFALSPGASAAVAGNFGSVPQTSGVTANDFSDPVNYTITAEDGTNIQNWTVTVNANKFSNNVSKNIDACESYTFDGVVYTTSGQYQGMFMNQDGCDSLVTLNLGILEPDFPFEAVETCEPYFFDGATRSTSGQYVGFFTNTHGCDSIVTLALTVYDGVCWESNAWSNGSGPDETENVILQQSYATGAYGSFVAKNLTILNGTLLEVEDGNSADIKGNIINNGTVEVFSGGTLLTYDGFTFTGNDIVLKRNTRYADGKYSMVGSPMQQSATVTGGVLGQYVYQYDETVPYSVGNQGLDKWVAASAEELLPGRGYTQANQQEITFIGKPNVGTVVYSGTYTTDDGINEGFNLVSNPYPAAINVADFLTTNTNIAGAIYLWDDNGSNAQRGTNADYVVANGLAATNTTPAGGASRYNTALGTAQGFFIKLNGAANTDVTFTESMRLDGSNADGNFFRTSTAPIVRINLTNEDELFKQTVLAWTEDASATALVRQYDAPVFDISSEYLIYSLKDGEALAIQAQPYQWNEVPIGINVGSTGAYSIEMEGAEPVFLKDHWTGEIADLTNESYNFTMNTTGAVTDRFSLMAQPAKVLSIDDTKTEVFSYEKFIHILQVINETKIISVYDLNGRLRLSEKVEGRSVIDASSLPLGIYIATDGINTYKLFLK